MRLDLHHALAEIVERALVGVCLAFEMEPDLEPARASVVPDLEVERRMAVMELAKPAVFPAGFECFEVLGEVCLEALAQAGEGVDRSDAPLPLPRNRKYLV